MDLELDSRVFIVSGGSKGLGRATAQSLVREGAKVVLLARDSDRVESVARSLGDSAVAVAGDLDDPTIATRAIELARDRFGRLDGALVSVGGPPAGSVLTTTDEQWNSAFGSVFLGGLRLMREVARATAVPDVESPGRGSSIAVVLSSSAVQVLTGITISNGLRPGLAMLVTDLADEVGPFDVRVNGLLPGRFDTERVRELDESTGDAEANRRRLSAGIPLRRYGQAEEFARIATFLLSPMSSYVSGTLVAVDGGATRVP
ncbi:MAG: SDR family oxidoreductase [Candidatus Nanopelagicales bacterium]